MTDTYKPQGNGLASNSQSHKGAERRKFLRLEHKTPLDYKVCKKETISKLLQGYTSDVSQAGLFCNVRHEVKLNDIVWLSFDRATLSICEELEKRCLIYQNGIIGKVVRAHPKASGAFDIGVRFLTREEQHIAGAFLKDAVSRK